MGSRAASVSFGQRLRAELDQREWGIRTLARHMESDPKRVETMRRNLIRYVQDKHVPTVGMQHAIADALGIPRDQFVEDGARRETQEAGDDDSEAASMALDLIDRIVALVALRTAA